MQLASTLLQIQNLNIMNIKTILFSIIIMSILGISACSSSDDDDGTPTPSATYSCQHNKTAYLKLDLSTGASHEVMPDDNVTGGVAITTDNGADFTTLNIAFSNSTGAYSLVFEMSSVAGTGTHTVDVNAKTAFITLANAGYALTSLTVTFDELTDPRDNVLNPDVDFYAKSSGTFSGSYTEPISGNSITFTGSFCSDTIED